MIKKLILAVMALATLAGCCEMNNNPLIKLSKGPHGTPEFSKIKLEHYMPAFDYAIEEAYEEFDVLVNNSDPATFENTIEALERNGETLNRVASVFFVLQSNETSDELQAMALEVQPKLVKFGNDINLNPVIFERVQSVYNDRENLDLDTEQMMLLEETYKGFYRSGAALSDDKKEIYRKFSTELSNLTLKFGQNVLAATNAFSINITDPAEVSDLPDFVKDMLASEAKSRGEQGWSITLQPSTMVPFMTYSSNRNYKEQLWRAYNSRCLSGELDNTANIKRITELRLEIAQLLGYNTYADLVLEECMAENAPAVNSFLKELLDATIDYAKKDVNAVSRYARKNGANYKIMPWDWGYWNEKYKVEKFSYNEEEVKPYFELESVKQGIFTFADKLFGIKFTENTDIEVYHPDVQAYDVTEENGDFIGVLYLDFFPRATKKGGAWMTGFRDMYTTADGTEVRPLVSMCCNFTKPTEITPSLLTFNEVETFLHEFGHCLHGLFAEGSYSSLTGTSVYRDFVELPSQVLENWATEAEFLDMIAVHYQTGEKMPKELIDKIVASKNYLAAYANVRQLSFGISDMAFHSITEPIDIDIADFEKEAMAKCQILPYIPETAMCSAFSHIFSGGYASGYYSYKWAEVLDADAFSLFKEKGIFNREVAEKFREELLSKGGTEHPMTLYVNFRGHKPETKALIDRMGLE